MKGKSSVALHTQIDTLGYTLGYNGGGYRLGQGCRAQVEPQIHPKPLFYGSTLKGTSYLHHQKMGRRLG